VSKGHDEVIIMKIIDVEELLWRLTEVDDPRRQWGNLRHLLVDILFICICAIVSKMEDIEGIVLFGQEREAWLRQYIRLENGIPSYSTFERVLRLLNPKSLERFYRGWIRSLRETSERGLINIDGKSICGAGAVQKVHMVSAWAREDGLCLGELSTEEKSNEITTIPLLLEAIDVAENVVTIDAMGCQKKIATKIVDRGADYILALKGNQPTLCEEVAEYFEWVVTEHPADVLYDKWISPVEKDHGRIEKRTVSICTCTDWPGISNEWTNLRCFVRYDCVREIKGEKTKSTRYYISSLNSVSAQDMAKYLRGHWSIENQLHWMLDVAFKEDASNVRMDHAPENLNVLRKVAFSLLKSTPSNAKASLRGKMTRAALNPDYLTSVIFGSK